VHIQEIKRCVRNNVFLEVLSENSRVEEDSDSLKMNKWSWIPESLNVKN